MVTSISSQYCWHCRARICAPTTLVPGTSHRFRTPCVVYTCRSIGIWTDKSLFILSFSLYSYQFALCETWPNEWISYATLAAQWVVSFCCVVLTSCLTRSFCCYCLQITIVCRLLYGMFGDTYSKFSVRPFPMGWLYRIRCGMSLYYGRFAQCTHGSL